ncbi:hypothetical protein MRB53_018902 [Persea americana]|uniref:Uncharacterized protein n=1 Tax=Persea americana TaxID=3435 RepID=A0ACC2M9W5_PERAE|nr:hypothetical protein MRB53_018902 [Persea americana]
MKAQPITAKTRGQISQSFTIKWDGRVFQALFATSRVCYLVILHSVRCFEILDETGSTRMPRRATLDRSEMGSVEMSRQANNAREKPKGNPYPIRGKIKEKIREDIYKLFTDQSGDAGGEERGRDGGDDGSSRTPSPA